MEIRGSSGRDFCGRLYNSVTAVPDIYVFRRGFAGISALNSIDRKYPLCYYYTDIPLQDHTVYGRFLLPDSRQKGLL